MALTLRSAFAEDKSLASAIGPTYSITRATKATMVDADGYIREVQSGEARFDGATFAHNLQKQSNDFDTSPWATSSASVSQSSYPDPFGGTDAWRLIDNGGGGTSEVRVNDLTITLEKAYSTYIFSAYMKADQVNFGSLTVSAFKSGTAEAYFNLSAGTVGTEGAGIESSGISDEGDGWYRCWIVFSNDDGDVSVRTFIAANESDNQEPSDLDGTTSIYIYGAQLERVIGATTPSTYIPTTTAAVSSLTGTSNGLLIEEARTNICLYSEDMSNAAWVASNVTKGSNASTAPDGSTTADRLTASAGNGTVLQSITSASADRSFAVYIKRVTGTGDIDLTVDGGSTWTTVAVDGTWTRFDIQQAAVTNPQVGFRIVTSADAVDVWGAQLEAGAFPTSYIPTTTASVTRNADADITPANVTWADATKGTFYVRAKMANVAAADQPLIELSDASTSDRIHMLCAATDGSLDLETDTTVGTDGDIAGTEDFTAGAFSNAVISYANDDCIVYLDGTSGGTETSATLPPSETLTKFLVGSNQDGEYGNCIISEIRFYDERSNTLAENLSNGLFPIPDVVGLTQSGAETLIEAEGFTVGTAVEAYSDSVDVGSVISQDGAAGTYVAAGTAVVLTISLGPEPSDATGGWLNEYNAYQQRKRAQERHRKEILQRVRELDGIDGEIAELMQLDEAKADEDRRIAEFRSMLDKEISKAKLDKAGLLNKRINRAYDRAMKKATYSAIAALEREIEDAIEEEEFALLVLTIT